MTSRDAQRINPNGQVFLRRMADLADQFLNVLVCRNCGSPRCEGYVCTFCHEDDEAVR